MRARSRCRASDTNSDTDEYWPPVSGLLQGVDRQRVRRVVAGRAENAVPHVKARQFRAAPIAKATQACDIGRWAPFRPASAGALLARNALAQVPAQSGLRVGCGRKRKRCDEDMGAM